MVTISILFPHLSPGTNSIHLSILDQQHLSGEMTPPPWPCWACHTLSMGKAVPWPAPALPPATLCACPLFLTPSTQQRPCPPAGAHGGGKDNLRKPRKLTPRLRVQGMPVLTPFPLIFLHLHSGFLRILPSLCPCPPPAPEPGSHLTLCHHPRADVRAVGKRTELQYSILGWFSYFLTFSVRPHLLLRGATAEELTLILTKSPAEAAYSP